MELPQIKGAGVLIPGDFYPIAPIVDRESETANKTTIVVFKPYAISELFYVHPTTKEMGICEPINTANVTFELNARDATNPFIVLVTYDYVNHEVIVRQSAAAAEPVAPEKGANELFLSSFTEQPIGEEQTEVPPAPAVNYFRVKQLTKAAGSYNDIADFTYSKVYLTVTGAVTIGNPLYSGADITIPDGKTLMLCLRGSAHAISWGSNFVMTDNSLDLSTSTSKWNKIIITKNEVSGKYEWCNTDTVTA